MSRFYFTKEFTKLERRIYGKAAHTACSLLGIEGVTVSIKYEFLHRGQMAMVSHKKDNKFIILLNIANEPQENVHSLGHELIHVAQYTRGDLSDIPEEKIILWKGERYPALDIRQIKMSEKEYLDQPWEAEAFAKHNDLFRKVSEQIPMHDREALSEENLKKTIAMILTMILK